MELEELIKQYLEKQLANEAEPAAAGEPQVQKAASEEFVTKEDLKGMFSGLAEEIAKALPVEREQGTGRRGVQAGIEKNGVEADPVEALVAKARTTPDKLEADEKEALWRMTYAMLTEGLRA